MWGQRARADLTDPKGTGRGGGQCPQCAFPEWQHVPGSDAWPPGGHRRRWGCVCLQGVGPEASPCAPCAATRGVSLALPPALLLLPP